MSRRPEPPVPSTFASPGGAGEQAGERQDPGWWRPRTWGLDLAVLARVRSGLHSIPDAGPLPADGAPPPGSPAAPPSPPDPPPAVPGLGPDPALAAIRETFAAIEKAGDQAISYFYARLFLRRPGLRELFPPAMDQQRDRLFRALARIVESLGTPEEMASYLSQLGKDHRKYGVEPDMYEDIGDALIATLRSFAGAAFSSAAEEAWLEAYTAAASLMIRAAEEDAAARPAFWTAEVVQNESRGHGIAVLTVAPDEGFGFTAGQHVTVQTPRWPRVWRPYSIACRPRDDGLLSLHVKAVPGGWVSNALVRHTRPGDELVLGPPLGTMTLRDAADRDLLCVAGGTGLSPVKAITEQAIRDSGPGRRREIFLFCGARTRDELYDLKDLWKLADAYPWLQLTPVTSDDPAFDGLQGSVGRVGARYVPHRDCETYVAGPPGMVRETIRVLRRSGIPRERIHYDDALLADHPHAGSGR